ncbi:HRDC domain-containing protein [Salininema proteolyticum]|uniref:HRDC domain-containing protein n=1 Tax=Salininema proteolyticum TaxID=1607685 RepID=A0ABV8U1C8_9ACTN
MTDANSSATTVTRPADGVPAVADTQPALDAAVARLRGGEGPVAVDTERASGFRYTNRAYLLQFKRAGSGIALVDPTADIDLTELRKLLAAEPWILHAASQDLPCLHELDLRPPLLFDTELAARLCGFEKVALGSQCERLLGVKLKKQHSAADWSQRPLPKDWLSYAALDVEFLHPLWDELKDILSSQGKLEWAEEEFEAERTAPPPEPRSEPWRRTSGIHRIRGRRALARVRALWITRDEIAESLDKAPSKVLQDKAIVEIASVDPTDAGELVKLPTLARRGRPYAKRWLATLAEVRKLRDRDLPAANPPHDGPPAAHRWAEKDPKAAARLKKARAAIAELAEENTVPVENLLTPAILRRLLWEPPHRHSAGAVAKALRQAGARSWQIEIVAETIAEVLKES